MPTDQQQALVFSLQLLNTVTPSAQLLLQQVCVCVCVCVWDLVEIRRAFDSFHVTETTNTHAHKHTVLLSDHRWEKQARSLFSLASLSFRFVYKNFTPVGSGLSTNSIRVQDTKPDRLRVCDGQSQAKMGKESKRGKK